MTDEEGTPPKPDTADSDPNTEIWRQVLTGTDPGLPRLRRMWGRVPSSPRCKLCAAPFQGQAGQAMLLEVSDPELVAGGVRVGVGVHAGEAFVGALGSDERLDFTAIGDTVNVAARLGSDAGAGELFVSETAWRAANRGGTFERRTLALKGRAEPLDVVVLRAEDQLTPTG